MNQTAIMVAKSNWNKWVAFFKWAFQSSGKGQLVLKNLKKCSSVKNPFSRTMNSADKMHNVLLFTNWVHFSLCGCIQIILILVETLWQWNWMRSIWKKNLWPLRATEGHGMCWLRPCSRWTTPTDSGGSSSLREPSHSLFNFDTCLVLTTNR